MCIISSLLQTLHGTGASDIPEAPPTCTPAPDHRTLAHATPSVRTVFFKSLRAPPDFLEPLFTCLLLCEVTLSSTVKSAPITLHKSEALIITGTTVHVYLFTSLLSTSLHCDVSMADVMGRAPACLGTAGFSAFPAVLGPQWAFSNYLWNECMLMGSPMPRMCSKSVKFLSLPLVKSFSLISSL